MKAFLMYPDRDFDLQGKPPWNEPALIQDLELTTLLNAMALGDDFLLEVARKAVLSSLTDVRTILYRQDILKDCLNNSSIIRDMYRITAEPIENRRKLYFGIFSRYPDAILHGSLDALQVFVAVLKKLRTIADEQASNFKSDGFTTLFAMIKRELTDEYFAEVQDHLNCLKFRDGVLVSAELGEANKGINYVLRKPQAKAGWLKRVFGKGPPVYSFSLPDRDESGARALSELRDRGLNLVANAVARSVEHILSFFTMLRTELAFYVGGLNLYERIGHHCCFPVPADPGERKLTFTGLYDVCLALTLSQGIVDNDLAGDGKDLVIVTGANQGGKSTFLRSLGLAQLMMQCGLFVPARSFSADICRGLSTHYQREEDVAMKSGKLDEELARMSDIVDNVGPDSLILFNESFAATNEREGSEIARQIISALLEKRIKVFFVTHLYDFAHSFFAREMDNAIFLRAGRGAGGERTFKITEGEPLPTSFGHDLYKRIFGEEITDTCQRPESR